MLARWLKKLRLHRSWLVPLMTHEWHFMSEDGFCTVEIPGDLNSINRYFWTEAIYNLLLWLLLFGCCL